MSDGAQLAVFPLSADPPTRGHAQLIRRALAQFSVVKVVLAEQVDKKYLFSYRERAALIKSYFEGEARVEVDGCPGLIADYCYRHGHRLLLRGLRDATDFTFESSLYLANRTQNRELETVYLLAEPSWHHVSSRMSREICLAGGDLRPFVNLAAKKALEEKLLGQFRICVTGPIAVGKSTIVRKMIASLTQRGVPAVEIDMDEVTAAVYQSREPGLQGDFSARMREAFGPSILDGQGWVDKNLVRNLMLSWPSREFQEKLGAAIEGPLESLLRQRLQGVKGLVFLSAAVGAERDWVWHCNNQVLLIHTHPEEQLRRLMAREACTESEAQKRLVFSGSLEHKQEALEGILKRDGFGQILKLDSTAEIGAAALAQWVDRILDLFPGLRAT